MLNKFSSQFLSMTVLQQQINLGQFVKVFVTAGAERCLCTESYPLITVINKPGTMESVIAENEW